MSSLSSAVRNVFVIAIISLISLLTVQPALAQVTTAELRGNVIQSDGSPMVGEQILIVHDPSGARRVTATNESGAFQVRGLRPGGPYTVSVVGQDISQDNVFLNISVPSVVWLAQRGAVEEVIVTGARLESGLRMGSSTVLDSQALNETATINRDFKNVIRQDPRVTIDLSNSSAISIGGSNNRLNSLTVDGVRQNDEFGLNQSGYPTQRTPLSMDAIEQISIETAPFDVEFGGFQGGTINIVTQSGNNEFHGSAYYFKTDDSMVGDKSEDRDINLGEFEEEFLGATLSGPIIKDKLWFFVSYEEFTGSDPDALLYGPAGSGAANEIDEVTMEDVALIRDISQRVYGYDPLLPFTNATDIKDEKWLAKLDWQINDRHNASFTWQYVDGTDLIDQGNSTRDGRLGLPSNYYIRGEEMTAMSLRLFSDWTDNFSTELKVAYKDVDNLQDPVGGTEFAQMEVALDNGGAIRFGPDAFRHANFLLNENFQVKLKADYSWGDHITTFGYEYDNVDIFNIFAPRSLGIYEFASVDDFENRRADSLFMANISTTGDTDDLAGEFESTIHSLYLQDRWDISPTLTMQLGFRWDFYESNDQPFQNENFYGRHGFYNTATLDGRDVFMPRFGFNWQPFERTTIRGGVGLFSGGVPSGFLSNSFSNVGLLNMSGFFDRDDLGNIEVDGYNIDPSLIAQLQPGDGDVAAIDPDFDIPSTWKWSLAWDQYFDIGGSKNWLFSIDFLYSDVKSAPVWVDLRREVFDYAADGRPVYGDLGCPAVSDNPMADCRDIPNWDIVMTSDGGGSNLSTSVTLAKFFDMGRYGGLDFRVAYTWMDAETKSDALSSTPTSLIGREQTYDRNNTLVGRSSFEITNRLISNITWRKDWGEHMSSMWSFFLQYQSGKPYGFTFNAPSRANGDTFGGNEPVDDDDTQLLYVPTGPDDPNVIFASGFDMEGWEALLASRSCLAKYSGRIAEQNSCTSPSNFRIDMRYVHEFKLPSGSFLGENSIELFLDIENLGNLINNEWGRVEQIGFPFTAQVVELDQNLGPNNELIFDSFRNENFSVFNAASLWKAQIGLRYRF
jgi:outer membrane receptor for ferrienterochelin and colicin